MADRVGRPVGWRVSGFPAIALVVGLWGVLYLPNLRTNPSWYGDETLTLMIGRSLFEGVGADRAFQPTFWHPSYSYQPVFAWLVGMAAAMTGNDIWGPRLLNTLIALAIALAIALLGRRPFGRWGALFASLTFLGYGQTVIHFRWIYPHNAVALGFTIMVLYLLRRASRTNDWRAGLGLACAAASHPLFVHGAIGAWLCRLKRPQSWLRLGIPAGLVLLAATGWTLSRQFPHGWLFSDVQTLGRFYGEFNRQNGSDWIQVTRNVVSFIRMDTFHTLAFVSVCLCCNRRFYAIPIVVGVVGGLLLQNRQNLPVFYYQAVVFLPVLAMAFAGALWTLRKWIRFRVGAVGWVRILPLAMMLIPITLCLSSAVSAVSGRLVPRNAPWVTQDTKEVEAAAEWINSRVMPEDLVLCHQNIGWLLRCRNADLMQATAWSGRPTFSFDPPPAPERFRFPLDLIGVKFVVIADIDQRWTVTQPNVTAFIEPISSGKWPIVWRGANYIILQNPTSLKKLP